mgnify:CR=1 FL=1
MNILLLTLFRTILIGLGATLIFDLWGIFLKRAFQIAPSDICLVGRWIGTMPEGVFRNANIRASAQKSNECAIGLLFGIVTVLAPFLIMQPAFGLGFAASKTPNPMQARLRSLMNHTAFGCGLYCFGWVVNWVM